MRTSASSPASAAKPAAKNRPTATSAGACPAAAAAATAIASITAPTSDVVRPPPRFPATGPPPRSSASGGCRPARTAATAIAVKASASVAAAPATGANMETGCGAKTAADPVATSRSQARPSSPTSSRVQSGPSAAPAAAPARAEAPPTKSRTAASRRGGKPTAARAPSVRDCAATKRPKSSQTSSKPATTTNDESARNRPPKGVDPFAAASASARIAITLMPARSGSMPAAICDARSVAATPAPAMCQAVVMPKRLPAIRRAAASDTNAFGVARYSFQ